MNQAIYYAIAREYMRETGKHFAGSNATEMQRITTEWRTVKQLYREGGLEMQTVIEVAKRLNIIRKQPEPTAKLTAFKMFLMIIDSAKPNEWCHPRWLDRTIVQDLQEAVNNGTLLSFTPTKGTYAGITFYRKAQP